MDPSGIECRDFRQKGINMHIVLLRTLLPRLASNRLVIVVIRHTGVALLAGIGARLGSDLYDAFKRRVEKPPPESQEESAANTPPITR